MQLITFSETKNIKPLYELSTKITFDSLVQGGVSSTFLAIKRIKGEKELTAIVVDMLSLFFFQLGINGLPPNQLTLFAYDFVVRNPHFGIEDVIHFCTFIKLNQNDKRIKIYGDLTILKLNEILSIYEDERIQANEYRHQQIKKDYDNSLERTFNKDTGRTGGTSLDKVKLKIQ